MIEKRKTKIEVKIKKETRIGIRVKTEIGKRKLIRKKKIRRFLRRKS